MADRRIPITHQIDPKTGDIHRIKGGEGKEVLQDLVIANYNVESQTVSFETEMMMRQYKQEVMTFLSDNEMGIRHWHRKDLPADEQNPNIPPRPKKNRFDGDKTPKVVEWYMEYYPNEFKTRYGVIGTYTGWVRILVPVWEPRPVVGTPNPGEKYASDGILEYKGMERQTFQVVDALLATRAVCNSKGERITFLSDECLDIDGEDEEGDEPTRPRITQAPVAKSPKKGKVTTTANEEDES